MFKCLVCEFTGKTSRSLSAHVRWYHGSVKSYYDKYIKQKGEGVCQCGKCTPFISLTRGYAIYCGYDCVFEKGSNHNKNISISSTGLEKKKGYKQSKEHIKKRILTGKKHPNYDPNITEEERGKRRERRQYSIPGYKQWRKAVFERDDYTCQICNKRDGSLLRAHHLEPYSANPGLRTTLENGVTVCNECHRDFHHQYGYHCTKEQFDRFLHAQAGRA